MDTNYFGLRDQFEIIIEEKLEGRAFLDHEYLKRLDRLSFLGIYNYAFNLSPDILHTRYDHSIQSGKF